MGLLAKFERFLINNLGDKFRSSLEQELAIFQITAITLIIKLLDS